jgi:hypothetical protein
MGLSFDKTHSYSAALAHFLRHAHSGERYHLASWPIPVSRESNWKMDLWKGGKRAASQRPTSSKPVTGFVWRLFPWTSLTATGAMTNVEYIPYHVCRDCDTQHLSRRRASLALLPVITD